MQNWTRAVRDLNGSINTCWVFSVESVSKIELVLSITFLIFFVIYGVECVQLTHSYRYWQSWGFVSITTVHDVYKQLGTLCHEGPNMYSFGCTLHYPIVKLCRFIWKHWTYRMLVRYIVSSPFSLSSFRQYMAVCINNLPIFLLMIVRIFVLRLLL